MSVIRVISLVGVAAMAASISAALITGAFFEEGSAIWALPWGKVSLIDLYVGLIFFAMWIALREGSVRVTAAWWLALLLLGNLAAGLYLAVAAYRSTTLDDLLTGERGGAVPDAGG